MLMVDRPSQANEMLSANEAGKILGVSGKTVVRMMEAGELTGYRVHFTWKFRRGDIEEYLDTHRYQPRQEDRD